MEHHANDTHAPMNGDDDLAKALHDGLQFEETPMSGDAPKTADIDVPPLPPLPPLPIDTPADTAAPTLTPSPEVPEPPARHGRGKSDDAPTPDEPADITMPDPLSEPVKLSEPVAEPAEPEAAPAEPEEELIDEPTPAALGGTASDDLDKLKASALEELRPLVGKLDLPAEEKFDTLLLIIRTTDDHTLLQEAHEATKEISDETRRAQALLDIVKEIDYFAGKR